MMRANRLAWLVRWVKAGGEIRWPRGVGELRRWMLKHDFVAVHEERTPAPFGGSWLAYTWTVTEKGKEAAARAGNEYARREAAKRL